MAGHPTVATIYALIQAGRIEVHNEHQQVTLELRVGVNSNRYLFDKGWKIMMTQKQPEFLSIHDPYIICSMFNLTPDDILEGVPIQTVSTGTPQVMFPLKSEASLKKYASPKPKRTSSTRCNPASSRLISLYAQASLKERRPLQGTLCFLPTCPKTLLLGRLLEE
jgi:PhzF family phenazine biosynthesis protein